MSAVIRPAAVASFGYEEVRVTHPMLAARLAGFFERCWVGPSSNLGVGAMTAYTVDLRSASGQAYAVRVLSTLRHASADGRGDWALHPEFKHFFKQLIAVDPADAAAARVAEARRVGLEAADDDDEGEDGRRTGDGRRTAKRSGRRPRRPR